MSAPQTTAGIDETLIEEIVRRVLTVAKPERIILFGSAANGPMTRDSDIDLLVVERELTDRREEYVRIRQALGSLGHPFDVLLISAEWFEATRDVIGGIAYPASRNGRTIYEAA